MKIDIENKILEVDSNTTLGEIVEKLEKVLSIEEWKNYRIKSVVEYIPYPYYINPSTPWWEVTCLSDNSGEFLYD